MMTVPEHARTVIIGGGVIGCSIAYHLAREGRKNIVVLERSKLTSGTTWHAAGLVRRLRPSASLTKLINYSIDLYGKLEKETGQQTGFLQTGSLSIATNEDRLTNLKRQVSLGRAFGLEAEIVDANRAKELWPLIEVDDVIGAVWSPEDGRVNPSDVTMALYKGAKALGVQFIEDTKVENIEKSNGRPSAVVTNNGRIACEEVVICSGLWSRDVAALAGAHVPLYACEHFYMLTKPLGEITGHLPTLNDQDAFLYGRDDVGGLLIGSFEPHAKALPMDRLPDRFSFDLLDEDWDHFMPMMEGALKRIPALETAEVRMLLNGPESFTLDSQFMMGESPEVPGLFILSGMNSTGISLAGGAGKAMAEWIVAGEPTMDLLEADIRRFGPEQNIVKALHERIPEVLGKHYELAYPGRQMMSARGIRRSPIHQGLKESGAQFNARNSWERAEFFAPNGLPSPWKLTFGIPPWRDLVGQEYKAAKETAIIYDQSAFGKILVQGTDAMTFLNHICANEINVEVGRIVYSHILNDRGGIESDITVQRLAAGQYLMIVGAGELVRDLAWLNRYKLDANVTFTDMTSAYAIIGLAGPRSKEILQAASMTKIPDFRPFRFADIEVGYSAVRAGRLSFTGEEGFELYVPADQAANVYEALIDAGASYGLHHAGMHCISGLRIEAGFRAWGHELSPATLPLEAGTDRFIAYDKIGSFKGRDALITAHTKSIKKLCVSMIFESPDAIALHDEPIFYQDRAVGQISSTAWSYLYGRSVALAFIDAPLEAFINDSAIVEGFEVEIACKRFRAKACLNPAKIAFKGNIL
ncbi:MAG: FAD-dependent oxidoreductase [Halopseudomonas aestusnigri]